MIILAIDPGTTHSGYAYFDTDNPRQQPPWLSGFGWTGKIENDLMMLHVERGPYDKLIIEDIVNQGINGRTIIQTVRWTGRFDKAAQVRGKDFEYISRPFVKKHLTGRVNGIRDSHIRQKVIDRLEPAYTIKKPGFLAGVKADAWQALALALTWSDLYSGI